MFRSILTAAIAASLACLSSAASAQTVDNQFKDWTVFTHEGLCYIGTAPKDSAKDGKVYLLVTQRKKNVDEVSASLGEALKAETPVSLTIGKTDFKLFSQEEVAWARDEATDAKIVGALKKASSVSVKATLESGKTATQKFSLSGFAAAYKRMQALCK